MAIYSPQHLNKEADKLCEKGGGHSLVIERSISQGVLKKSEATKKETGTVSGGVSLHRQMIEQ